MLREGSRSDDGIGIAEQRDQAPPLEPLDGRLLPHLELSHGPFKDKDGASVDIALGNAARKEIGNERWVKRVRKAIYWFNEMLWFDRLYVGGGNAKHLSPADVGERGEIVPNTAGITGGVRVWALDPENN